MPNKAKRRREERKGGVKAPSAVPERITRALQRVLETPMEGGDAFVERIMTYVGQRLPEGHRAVVSALSVDAAMARSRELGVDVEGEEFGLQAVGLDLSKQFVIRRAMDDELDPEYLAGGRDGSETVFLDEVTLTPIDGLIAVAKLERTVLIVSTGGVEGGQVLITLERDGGPPDETPGFPLAISTRVLMRISESGVTGILLDNEVDLMATSR